MNFEYYRNYYFYLEKRFKNLERYIAFEMNNLDTYSIELSSFISDCGGIFNGFMYEACKEKSPQKDKFYYSDYKSYLQTNEYYFESKLAFYGFRLMPLSKIASQDVNDFPKWWTAYNSIKHGGQENFKQATLRNAFSILGVLFSVLCQYELKSPEYGLDTVNGEASLFCESIIFFTVNDSLPLSWEC